jgi:hypothetical protein
MPSTSKKQHNFMEAIAHSPSFAKKVGVPQSVGQDFATADKGKKFSKGGDTMATQMDPKMLAMLMAKKRSMGGAPQAAMPMGGMKKGGMAMFEKSGKDVEKTGMKEGSKADMALDKKQMMGMKKGGMAEGGMSDMAQDKAMIKKAFKQHDEQEHKGGKGTSLKLASGGYTRAADGIAQRGKTKGTQIAMCGGGMAYGKKK